MNVRFLWRMAIALLVIAACFIRIYLDYDGMMVKVFNTDLLRDQLSTANSITRLLNSNEYGMSVGSYRMGVLNRGTLRYNLDYLHSKYLASATSSDDLIEMLKFYHASLDKRMDIQFSVYDPVSREFLFGGDYLSTLKEKDSGHLKGILEKLSSSNEAFQSVDVTMGKTIVDTVDCMAQKHDATGDIVIASLSREQLKKSGIVIGTAPMKDDVVKGLESIGINRVISIFDQEGKLFATNAEEAFELAQVNREGQKAYDFARENLAKISTYEIAIGDTTKKYFTYSTTYHKYTILILTDQKEYSRHFEIAMYVILGVAVLLLLTILYTFRKFIKYGEGGWE